MPIRAYENFDEKQRTKEIELVKLNSDRQSYCGNSDVFTIDTKPTERWEIPEEMREEFKKYYSVQ